MSSLSSAGGSECWSSDEIPLSGIALHFFGNDEGCEVDRTETATPVQLRLFREVEATVAVCSLDTAAVADHNCSSLLPLGDILSEVIVEIGDKVEYSPDAPRHLHLNFALNAMPAILRYALGLGDIEVLTVTLKFDSNKFGASTQPQCAVTCSKTQDPQPSQQNGCDEPSHLPAEPMLPDTDDLQHSAPADQEDPLTCCGPSSTAKTSRNHDTCRPCSLVALWHPETLHQSTCNWNSMFDVNLGLQHMCVLGELTCYWLWLICRLF